ncbi:MAG: hypothetical protein ACLP52_23365 [Streptosporangiaceae bacterium]
MGEIPFQNPANDEADERPGETPGERAQRLYEQAAGARQPGADAGPGSGAHEFDPDDGDAPAPPGHPAA